MTFATLNFYPRKDPRMRFFALWYFTILLILWTILGDTVLGFEQSYAQPVIGVLTACAVAFLLEWVDARSNRRTPRFAGNWANAVNFLPPCIIPGLACAMLIYTNERLTPIIFAAALSVASKVIFRAPIGNGQTQHIFNPSNLGITATLLLLPAAGLAPPYQFTENVTGFGHWAIPAVILGTGAVIHGKFTGRLPLVLAWFGGFAAQAVVRSYIFHAPLAVPFLPMTSAAFILFSLYMIPDPATTPIKPLRQVAFGLSVATIYALLFVTHVVFGLFIALALTSAARGIALHAYALWKRRLTSKVEVPADVPRRAIGLAS
ncbi:MAG TPA: enediyne biosynthesis protein UnbU [Candidatus Angelobacter sp.]|nr:enediyne biosynthesis protein UnbU [Candidatus Angelobacter sp.]